MIANSLHHILLSAPLFLLIFMGYLLIRVFRWNHESADALSRFVFNVLVPALLFTTTSHFSTLPAADPRLLIAYFGSCLIVFVIGRIIGGRIFSLDGSALSVFGIGCVFSNNVFLGIPIAKEALGEAALSSVSLVIALNALVLWTLVSVTIEWALHGSVSLKGFGKMAAGVLTNPVVASLALGLGFDASGWALPELLASPLHMLSEAASPMALVVLGMGLGKFGFKAYWQVGSVIAALKLLLQPMVVWGLARLLDLPKVETQAIVMLASIAVGFNVYLMANQFRKMEGAVASSLVLSTLLASLTTPIAISMTM